MKLLTLCAVAFAISIDRGESQSSITALDAYPISSAVRFLRVGLFRFLGSNSKNIHKFENNLKSGKLQKQFSPSEPFPCNTTSMRSAIIPDSVHMLTPADIDIVGAMGDSLTAGNGAMATQVLEVAVENRGISSSIGGQGTWRQFLTIPNILKEFNPNLYGYSIADGLSHQKSSRFNVAEIGAMTQDLPHQAKNLVKRMLSDPKVDMQNHWKLITILIGDNDFCSNMCYFEDPNQILLDHENNLVRALRILRDHLPRTMVNVVSTPNVRQLTKFKGRPYECVTLHMVACPCMFGSQFELMRQKLHEIIISWNKLQQNVSKRVEFNDRSDFTVNYQPFAEDVSIPHKENGNTDFSFFSQDCFHFSQKGYATAAISLWNNMLEEEGQKTNHPNFYFSSFRCPSQEYPYLMTKANSNSKPKQL